MFSSPIRTRFLCSSSVSIWRSLNHAEIYKVILLFLVETACVFVVKSNSIPVCGNETFDLEHT